MVSARKWERGSRHKMNPNCPSYGTRLELRVAGLLTDELPEVDYGAAPFAVQFPEV
jgi:hypothetical protein